jgi:SAM-dependent methyltransferase
MPERDGALDPEAVDGALLRAHLEIQRLHEEFSVGATMRALLVPMIALVRRTAPGRTIRVVDVGCGLGYVLRWLSTRGDLGDDVELVGADYNRAFVAAANRLAEDDGARCRFVAANAFRLSDPADVFISTGVLHHFRGDDLVRVFREHERSRAVGFVHVDIRPSFIAPIGSWIFHQARMREPLARFDGYWSAVRAHAWPRWRAAIREGAPAFALGAVDVHPGLFGIVRIFQAAVGVRGATAAELRGAYAALGRRFEEVA